MSQLTDNQTPAATTRKLRVEIIGPGESKGRRTGSTGCASGEGNDPGSGADCPHREALKWALANVGPLADSRVGLKERVRRLNRFRDHLEGVLYGGR